MRNRFSFFRLICCFSAATSLAQDDDGFYTLMEQGIYGPVRSVTTIQYEITGIEKRIDDHFQIDYSDSGAIIRYKSLDEDSSVSSFEMYEFKNRQLQRIESFWYLPRPYRDTSGKPVIPTGGQKYRHMYLTTFLHDRQGRITERTLSDTTGKILNRQTFSYNRKGQLKHKTETYERFLQPSVWHYTFSYDKAGKPVKTISGEKHQLINQTIVVYENGLKVSENTGYRDHGHFFLCETDFFENGLIVKHEQYGDGHEILSSCVYTYEFDSHGNWTKKTVAFEAGTWVWERTFVYD